MVACYNDHHYIMNPS